MFLKLKVTTIWKLPKCLDYYQNTISGKGSLVLGEVQQPGSPAWSVSHCQDAAQHLQRRGAEGLAFACRHLQQPLCYQVLPAAQFFSLEMLPVSAAASHSLPQNKFILTQSALWRKPSGIVLSESLRNTDLKESKFTKDIWTLKTCRC